MSLLKEAAEEIRRKIECKPLSEDPENWYKCLAAMDRNTYVPLQYKPGFLKYQEAYFKDVYEGFEDISMVLYRGGRPVGIWPVSIYLKDGKIRFCTAESALLGPLFPFLPKAEGQRSVIGNCLGALLGIPETDELLCAETVTEQGGSQWIRVLMEYGGKAQPPKWEVFTDLNLTREEIQARIRRTNKYSIAKGQEEYECTARWPDGKPGARRPGTRSWILSGKALRKKDGASWSLSGTKRRGSWPAPHSSTRRRRPRPTASQPMTGRGSQSRSDILSRRWRWSICAKRGSGGTKSGSAIIPPIPGPMKNWWISGTTRKGSRPISGRRFLSGLTGRAFRNIS